MQASLIDDYYSAGVALNNIAQEYQRIQAPLVSLNYVNQAIEMFERGCRRAVNYYLGYLQRCHILIQLNRKSEAFLDYQHCLVAEFPTIKEAVKLLAPVFGEDFRGSPDSSKMTMFWQDREAIEFSLPSRILQVKKQFTESESKILKMLSSTHLTRWEIIEQLYGKDLDPLVAENRVKVLLSKIRKKRPGIINLSSGKYSLCRDLYPELKMKLAK